MKRYISLFFDLIEEALFVFFLPIIIVSTKFYKIRTQNHTGQKDLIIVQRWLYKNSFSKWRINRLRKNGINVYGFFDNFATGSFEDSADKLKEFIEQLELKNVILVGVSSGGITCLTYLNKYNWRDVDKFIALGSPFKGTPFFIFLSFLSSARALLPGSNFLKKQVSKISGKKNIYCIHGLFDGLVSPRSSTIEGSNEIRIDVIGHHNLHTLDKRTIDTIIGIMGE